MASAKCKKCNGEVGNFTLECPHCGIKNPALTAKDCVFGSVGIIAIVFAFLAFSGGDDAEAAKQEPQVVSSTEKVPAASKPAQETPYTAEIASKVKAFCYAKQAGQLCDGLKMRMDTEDAFYSSIGYVPQKGVQAPEFNDCASSFDAAIADEKKDLCQKAEALYGCNGTEIKALLTGWPTETIANPKQCAFGE
ncbi:hypothetical protein ACK31R_09700 [Aeromonas caviae]